nr:hypothetical protein [Streptomyces globisporus]
MPGEPGVIARVFADLRRSALPDTCRLRNAGLLRHAAGV